MQAETIDGVEESSGHICMTDLFSGFTITITIKYNVYTYIHFNFVGHVDHGVCVMMYIHVYIYSIQAVHRTHLKQLQGEVHWTQGPLTPNSSMPTRRPSQVTSGAEG